MSEQVMRFDVYWEVTMRPEPNGDWVEVEDFEALQARSEKAEAERDALREVLIEAKSRLREGHILKSDAGSQAIGGTFDTFNRETDT